MKPLKQGFFIERIAVSGEGLPPAELAFTDGLNVVAGASDTGKSYLGGLVDFGFGASRPPRAIDAAKGYGRLVMRIRARPTNEVYEIERALIGGNVVIRRLDQSGRVVEKRDAAVKHSHGDTSTLSSLLLGLSGFKPLHVRKNRQGETRSLSFRDVAFLTVVDEARIISENAPQLSGSPVETTSEGDVLRLMVTGLEAASLAVVPKKNAGQTAKAQLELVAQLVSETKVDLASLQLDPATAVEELAALDATRAEAFRVYESSRVALGALEKQLSENMRELRDSESRLIVIEGLVARFNLLERHYASDVERLGAVQEAGELLEALPAKDCPVCGAAPEAHRRDQAAEHYGLSNVRVAAAREREKTESLRLDLSKVLAELAAESTERAAKRDQLRAGITARQGQIANELQPRVRASAEQLQQRDGRRDALLKARALIDRLNDLNKRGSELESAAKKAGRGSQKIETGPRTADMESFAVQVHAVLEAWKYPGLGRVVFSDSSQDLVIAGQERASHGKGVRALTCAAFIAGLMRHDADKQLPHPGLVVLDSPLVAYKDPDNPSSEDVRLRKAGVKDAFYRALADGLCRGQVIVLENEDPSPDLAKRITHHHFTKNRTGRYGLFPTRSS